MVFTSVEFAIFLPIIFLIYWFLTRKKLAAQNLFLLIASYFFYGWWDWRFLLLLASLSLANYSIGILIEKNVTNRKKYFWLITGLIINIGVLGFFKYFNFFIESFIDLVSIFGYNLSESTTKVILPMGISFYVFLSLSYIIDIYKKNLSAEKNIIHVLLALSFFPIILAGPIQRPITLLPQIMKRREFRYDQTIDGLRQILWGLFTKIVVADKLAPSANDIFQNFYHYSGSTLLIGALFFTVQIYADFSGYSNIAIGTGKLLGFNLMRNFAYPYFSRDITEFWKRWHISLTTWLSDYIFFPISFSISWRIKSEKVIFIRSDMVIYIAASTVTWFLTGLWHGANYTFILWGMINGFFMILYFLQKKPRKSLLKKIGISNYNPVLVFFETLITLSIVVLCWIFFKADSVHHAFLYLSRMFSRTFFSIPQVFPKWAVLFAILFLFSEWLQRKKDYALQIENIKYRLIRWGIYYLIILFVLRSMGHQQQFIYSQF